MNPTTTDRHPHWSVERNLAGNGYIRLIATDAGTCAVACDRQGNIDPDLLARWEDDGGTTKEDS